MTNKAKCKLCNEVIESTHRLDCVACKCGNIAVKGCGEDFECWARDWKAFVCIEDETEIKVRVDDDKRDSEIPVPHDQVDNSGPVNCSSGNSDMDGKIARVDVRHDPARRQILKEIDHLISYIEGLPLGGQNQLLNQMDLHTVLLLLKAILKCDNP